MNTCSPVRALIPLIFVAGLAAAPAAQGGLTFGAPRSGDLVAAPFSDREIARLVGVLDQRLGARKTSASDARSALWEFVRRLQTGRLSPAQQDLVLKRLDEVAVQRPELADVVVQQRYLVSALTVGKLAPEIDGLDLDGTPFRLSDYRGNVVVLAFTGEWCGICRSEYPYQRLMLELYQNWPFALVSVESGTNQLTAKKYKLDQGLFQRSWWDGPPRQDRPGSIASAWSVAGWPTTYVLDASGVIRFVDLRKEDLLKAVRQLLDEHVAADTPVARKSAR